MLSKVICPSEGSLVVGPMEPATNRLRPLKLAATSRASFAAAKLISYTLSCKSYSASTTRVAPKVSVSTISLPTLLTRACPAWWRCVTTCTWSLPPSSPRTCTRICSPAVPSVRPPPPRGAPWPTPGPADRRHAGGAAGLGRPGGLRGGPPRPARARSTPGACDPPVRIGQQRPCRGGRRAAAAAGCGVLRPG